MLKHIQVKNFKSINSVDFDIPEFAVILGHNAAGKSNLLAVIKFVALLASGRQVSIALKSLNIWPSEILNDPSNPSIEIIFDLILKNQPVKYSLLFTKKIDSGEIIVQKEQLTINAQVFLERANGSPIIIRKNNATIPSNSIVNNLLAISVLDDPPEVVTIKEWFANIVVDTFEPSILRDYGDPNSNEKTLAGVLAEKIHYLKKDPKSLQALKDQFKKMIDSFEEVDVETLPNEGLLLKFKDVNSTNEYHSFSASNGNLRTMGIISALYGQSKLSALIIDEIENSLHPSRIKSIMRFLEYQSEGDVNKLQIILTTHNPLVLDYVSQEQLLYCFRKNGNTQFVNPYLNEKVQANLKPINNQLTSLRTLYTSGLLEKIFSET